MSNRLRQVLIVYKQYRFEVVGVLALGLFLVVGMLVSAWQFSGVHLPKGCDAYTARNIMYGWGGPKPTIECLNASQAWLDINDGLIMRFAASPFVLPFVAGIILGAPLVAREVETGTAAISWALAGSRRRWLLGRMGAMLLIVLPLLLAAGFAADLLYGAMNQGADPWASFRDFQSRGLPLLFWGLASFGGTVALSSLTGRHAVTLILAALICLTVRAQWDAVAGRTWLQPFAQTLASPESLKSDMSDADWNVDLILTQRMYLDGQPWDGDMNQWFDEHMVTTKDPNGMLMTMPDPNAKMPQSIGFGFYHDQFWPVVAMTSGILFAGSLFCAVVGLFWVARRKPY